MPESEKRTISNPKGGSVFQDLSQRIKLILRLMGDPRVSPLLKVLPIGTLLYLIIPDIAPGPIDDAAIIWLGTYLFVELCPPDVVQEHMAALNRVVPGEWQDPVGKTEEEIVDAEFWEEKK
jgi:hypothetical protein